MLAREETMESEFLKGELQKVLPVVNTERVPTLQCLTIHWNSLS